MYGLDLIQGQTEIGYRTSKSDLSITVVSSLRVIWNWIEVLVLICLRLSVESFRVKPDYSKWQIKAKLFFSLVSSLICALRANEPLVLCVLTGAKRWLLFLTMALIADKISVIQLPSLISYSVVSLD